MDQPASTPMSGPVAIGSRERRTSAIPQLMLVFALVGGLVLVPPARGRMMLIPLHGTDHNGLARIAATAGAALVDRGPFNESLIVSGERSALMGAMLRGRVLVLRAIGDGCNSAGTNA